MTPPLEFMGGWKGVRSGLVGLALLLAGCVPPPLSEESTSFEEEVAPLVAQRCGIAGCHGAPSQGNFAIPSGQGASADDVRRSLEGLDTIAGVALVEPGAPEASALYVRLLADPPQQMPPGVPLSDAEISMIRAWIADGAPYE